MTSAGELALATAEFIQKAEEGFMQRADCMIRIHHVQQLYYNAKNWHESTLSARAPVTGA